MTNGNDPVIAHLTYNSVTGAANGFVEGLSKREYFAAMAMQGVYSNHHMVDLFGCSETICEEAVNIADSLIAALNKPQTEGGDK